MRILSFIFTFLMAVSADATAIFQAQKIVRPCQWSLFPGMALWYGGITNGSAVTSNAMEMGMYGDHDNGCSWFMSYAMQGAGPGGFCTSFTNTFFNISNFNIFPYDFSYKFYQISPPPGSMTRVWPNNTNTYNNYELFTINHVPTNTGQIFGLQAGCYMQEHPVTATGEHYDDLQVNCIGSPPGNVWQMVLVQPVHGDGPLYVDFEPTQSGNNGTHIGGTNYLVGYVPYLEVVSYNTLTNTVSSIYGGLAGWPFWNPTNLFINLALTNQYAFTNDVIVTNITGIIGWNGNLHLDTSTNCTSSLFGYWVSWNTSNVSYAPVGIDATRQATGF